MKNSGYVDVVGAGGGLAELPALLSLPLQHLALPVRVVLEQNLLPACLAGEEIIAAKRVTSVLSVRALGLAEATWHTDPRASCHGFIHMES